MGELGELGGASGVSWSFVEFRGCVGNWDGFGIQGSRSASFVELEALLGPLPHKALEVRSRP